MALHVGYQGLPLQGIVHSYMPVTHSAFPLVLRRVFRRAHCARGAAPPPAVTGPGPPGAAIEAAAEDSGAGALSPEEWEKIQQLVSQGQPGEGGTGGGKGVADNWDPSSLPPSMLQTTVQVSMDSFQARLLVRPPEELRVRRQGASRKAEAADGVGERAGEGEEEEAEEDGEWVAVVSGSFQRLDVGLRLYPRMVRCSISLGFYDLYAPEGTLIEVRHVATPFPASLIPISLRR